MHALTSGALERQLRMVATWWKEWNFSCTGDKVRDLIRK
jgi:hypothetical protein